MDQGWDFCSGSESHTSSFSQLQHLVLVNTAMPYILNSNRWQPNSKVTKQSQCGNMMTPSQIFFIQAYIIYIKKKQSIKHKSYYRTIQTLNFTETTFIVHINLTIALLWDLGENWLIL